MVVFDLDARLTAGEPLEALERPPASLVPASLEGLMERYVDGDEHAFEALFTLLRGPLTGSLRHWLKTDDRIDDAIQVTLLKLHTSRQRYRRGAPVLPWVLTIARNVALDRLRLKHTRDRPLEEEHLDRLTSSETDFPWSEQDELEVGEAVRRAIEQLPPSSRELVRLHKIEGRPMAEVAEILGIREGSARVRAHRAYKILAKLLVTVKPSSSRT